MTIHYVVKNDHVTNHVKYSTQSFEHAITSGIAATDIEAVMTLAGAGGDILLYTGTWSLAELDSSDGIDFPHENQTLRGVSNISTFLSGLGGADHVVITTKNGTVVRDVAFKDAPAGKANFATVLGSGNTATLENCVFTDIQSSGRYINCGSGTTIIKNNMIVGGDGAYLVRTEGDTCDAVFLGNRFLPSSTQGCCSILGQNNGNLTASHNVFVGCAATSIVGAASFLTAHVDIRNNVFLGSRSTTSATQVSFSSGVTGPVDYNYFGITAGLPGAPISGSGLTIGSHNALIGSPKFKQLRKGYIAISVDDYYPGKTWEYLYGTDGTDGLVALVNSYGFGITWYIDTARWSMASEKDEKVMWAVENGVEIGVHSRTHSDLTYSGTIFTVSKGTETITVSRSNDTISLSGGGVVSGFRSKTLAQIKTDLEALGATVTPSINYNTSAIGTIQSGVRGEAIADVSGGSVLTCYPEGYLEDELFSAVDALEAVNGVNVASMAYPFGAFNDSIIAIIKGARDRKIKNARVVNIDSSSSNFISGMNLYKIPDFGYADIKRASVGIGGTEQDIRANVSGLAGFVCANGSLCHMMAHGPEEMTLVEWGYVFDELLKWQESITVASSVECLSDIATYATDTDGTLSYTWSQDVIDLRMSNSSPCVDAGAWITGVNDTGEADPWGNYVHRLPNIGADQGAGSPGSIQIVFEVEA